MSGAVLDGVRAIELAHEATCWAGKLLADMGAEVIVVEPPSGSPMRHYAPFVSDADMQPSGNVLVTHGGLVEDPTASLFDPENLKYSVIEEVTYGATPEVVFTLTMKDEATTDPVSYTIYRAEGLDAL